MNVCPLCGRESARVVEHVRYDGRGGYFVDHEYVDCGHVDVDTEGGV